MNSIVIVGRAVRDAEVRYSTGEKSTAYGNMPTDSDGFMHIPSDIDDEVPFA